MSRTDVQLVVAALREIDPIYRDPFTLFYPQDFSYQEIARALALPPGTAMSRLFRGKIQLRSLLERKSRVPDAA